MPPTPAPENRDVVVIGGVEWSEEANQTPAHAVRAFAARHHRVLYVYAPTQGSRLRNLWSPVDSRGRWESMRGCFKSMALEQVGERVWIAPLSGLLGTLPLSYPEPLRLLNARLLARFLRSACQRIGFHEPVLWFYWWFFPELPEAVPHWRSAYDCIDEHANYPRNRWLPALGKAARRNEARLLARADVSFVVSPDALVEKAPLSRRLRYSPLAIDVHAAHTALADGSVPADVAELPRPVVGYAGGVGARIDFDLVAKLADLRPEWTFALVGGPRPPGIPTRPNVRFLPGRSYAEMLRSIRGFDVAVVPFVDDTFTRRCYPLKLLDYLFVEKPVVATRLPAVLDLARECPSGVTPVGGADEWVVAIERALDGGRQVAPAEWRRVAAAHNIERRFAELMAHLETVESDTKR